MKKDVVELVFILDRSGSMSGLEEDTIGGYNAMLGKQKKLDGEARITTVLFDDKYELVHDRIPLAQARPMTDQEYYVRGTTALLDALGSTILKTDRAQKLDRHGERPARTLFVITTDGMENASREFGSEQVKGLVEYAKAEYGWEFLFLGANIDAAGTAASCGISEDMAADYHADGEGTRLNYKAVDEAVSSLRAGNALGRGWKTSIERDFKGRSGSRHKG